MTYCVGVQVDEGLVFLSDSRTNAGVDHVSTFRKMTFFEMPGDLRRDFRRDWREIVSELGAARVRDSYRSSLGLSPKPGRE